MVGPTEALIPQPATAVSAVPAAVTRPPAARKPVPVPVPASVQASVPGSGNRVTAAPEQPSGWQLAQRVWADSGISWENAMTRSADAGHYDAGHYDAGHYDPGSDPYLAGAYADAPAMAGWSAGDQADLSSTRHDLAAVRVPGSVRYASFTPREPAPSPPAPTPCAPQPAFSAYPDFAAPPLGAPVSYAEPAAGQPAAYAPGSHESGSREPGAYEQGFYDEPATYSQSAAYGRPRMWDSPAVSGEAAARPESDELFRAWQGSVREAAGHRPVWAGRDLDRRAARRSRARSAARIGVPAVVIVTVGAGALLMLTGRANEMLAVQSGPGATASATPAFSGALSPAGRLAGYPGQHGMVAVAALWSAGGLTLASGTADGHPALWRRSAPGSWSLVSAAALAGVTGHLTGITRGPLGWVAVGSVAVNGTAEPALYQSGDGVTWTQQASLTTLAGGQAQFLGVTANAGGYVVAGKAVSGAHAYAALWSSSDLKNWTVSGNSGAAGSFAAAVTSAGTGFAAAGSERDSHTIWTSPDGRAWTAHDLATPTGATSATLRLVAAGSDGRFVAAGYAVTGAGDIPLVVTAADGGQQLTQVVLSSPGGPATVTAVTAAGNGFVAAGLAGSGSAQRAVTWTSKDGLTWSPATPLSAAGRSEITALAATGTSAAGPAVTGAAQHGAAASLLTIAAP